MKCPKCSYVGYEATDRCRHCGYDFSLSMGEPAAPPTPRMEPVPLPSMSRERLVAPADVPAGLDLPLQQTEPSPAVAASTSELFAEPPPPAGTPLAVRRTTERVRSRGAAVKRPRPALLDATAGESVEESVADPTPDLAVDEAAPPGARLLSAALDVLLLVAIDASVVYFTAKIAAIPLAEVVALPLAPLATFLVGLNVAYLTVFTANGGQTLGKMAAGLRVEGTDGPLTFGDATVRVVVAIVGGLAAGAGFLPALWRHDRRAVHDQIAHTRVVKVTA